LETRDIQAYQNRKILKNNQIFMETKAILTEDEIKIEQWVYSNPEYCDDIEREYELDNDYFGWELEKILELEYEQVFYDEILLRHPEQWDSYVYDPNPQGELGLDDWEEKYIFCNPHYFEELDREMTIEN